MGIRHSAPGTRSRRAARELLPGARWLMPAAFVAAAVNLAAGVWLLLQPGRTADFERVMGWASMWASGASPYAFAEAGADYPPWALVTLSPMLLVPEALRPGAWVAVNLVLLAALASRLVREAGEPTRIRLALVALLLATASARTWTQFSLLSGLLGVCGALSGSPAGAIAVGLALIKPQIGGVALVWMLLARQWSRVAIALAVPVVLTAIFGARLDIEPTTLARQLADTIGLVHGGDEPFNGHTELRAWLVQIWPAQAGRLSVAVVLAIVLLSPAAGFALRARRWTPDQSLELLAACGAASLLAFRHLSYDFILLWPAVVAWRAGPWSATRAAAPRAVLFAGLAGFLVVEPPAWARLAVSQGAPPWVAMLTEADRLAAIAAWSGLSWSLWRQRARLTVVPPVHLK